MPIDMPKKEETEFKLVPEGVHVARCYSFIDLGTQDGEWQGQPILARKVRITFEIPGERIEYKKDGKDVSAPMSIGNMYTFSFSEKANLRKMFKSWVPEFDPEAEQFDENLILGRPALITINHTEKTGKKYANIVAVTPLVKGMECPEQENPQTFFTVENFTGFENLPEWLKNQVKKSHEYRNRQSENGGKSESEIRYDGLTKPDGEIPF